MSIALVQSKLGGNGTASATSVTSSAVGYTSNTTSGNLLVLIAWARKNTSTGGNVPSIGTPATSGITWVLAKGNNYDAATTDGFTGAVAIYYVANAPSVSSATTTSFTAAVAETGSFVCEFSLYEFSGVAVSSPLETTAGSNTGSSIPNAGNLITSFTDLLVTAYQGDGSSVTVGSGWTLSTNATTATPGQAQYILNQGSGTKSCAFGSSSSGSWGASGAAFKQGGAAATGSSTGFSMIGF